MVPSPATPYTGRFAPSPTGPLHFGSLATAVASYLDARHHEGRWLVRMEDIDPPREMPGAADRILQQLEAHGLHWDDAVLYQSQRSEAYQEVLQQLLEQDIVYPCHCSRQQLKERGGLHLHRCSHHGDTGGPYALRLGVTEQSKIGFEDIFQGKQQQHIKQTVGDFVLLRKDGLFAYQLAVVVDDAFQQISHIIRGSDLLNSTARQIYLQQVLSFSQPLYGHLPVAVDLQGHKLSKQNLAKAVDEHSPTLNLWTALQWLKLTPPEELRHTTPEQLLAWGVNHWQREAIPHLMLQPAPIF
ncbi:tRNA glutamyl-Q(34) synthetase GluQRS [Porticoccus sp.]